MNVVLTVLAGIFLAIGIFFVIVGVTGMLRFHDFYARVQAVTCIGTLGVIGAVLCAVCACIDFRYPAIWYVKLFVILLLILISSAIVGHALAKSAHRRGYRPEGGFVKDDYEEDGCDEL